MMTKRAHCSCCSNGSNNPIWEATSHLDADANLVPIWECRSCHSTMPRRVVRKTSAIAALLDSGEPMSLDAVLEAMRADCR
jgi:formate dehydrogenase maturation protein FdhE